MIIFLLIVVVVHLTLTFCDNGLFVAMVSPKYKQHLLDALVFHSSLAPRMEVCQWNMALYAELVEYRPSKHHR
jgi:hypothetical protein